MTIAYLVEITVAIDAAGATTVLRFSTTGYKTRPSDTPANTHYARRVTNPALITRNLYSNGTTSGASRVGYGVVELSNIDGALDFLLDYGFDGRALVIKVGQDGAAYSTFTTILSGTMEQPEFTLSKVTILARDKLAVLDMPLQKTLYAGTNSLPTGVEGVSDIKGNQKPKLYGKVFNISPVLVNTSKLIYQISDSSISAIAAVYDQGLALTAGTAYSTLTDLYNNSPAAGTYTACLSLGLFRLGSSAVGLITCDASQGTNDADRTAAQLLKSIAIDGGVASGDINTSDVTALDALNSSVCGAWVNGADTAISIMDQVAQSIGAWYGFDATGAFRMGRFDLPSGASTLEINQHNIKVIDKIRPSDTDHGIPAWRAVMFFKKNYTIQNTDLAGAVTDARRNELNTDYLNTSTEDASIKNKFILSPELVRKTLLVDATAAANEASRVLTLYKTRRDLYKIQICLNMAGTLPDLNGITNVTLNRFGMTSGKIFRIIGIESDYVSNRATLTVWG